MALEAICKDSFAEVEEAGRNIENARFFLTDFDLEVNASDLKSIPLYASAVSQSLLLRLSHLLLPLKYSSDLRVQAKLISFFSKLSYLTK